MSKINNDNDVLLEKDEKIQAENKLTNTKSEIINKIINEDYSNLTIAIKSPHLKGTKHWGELFFSKAIKKSFEKYGFKVIIQAREEWYNKEEFDNICRAINDLNQYVESFTSHIHFYRRI